ncbi:hypothetical protein SORBI_3001G279601 [Sorghum bicolor]|uniref:Uncharacterized protein n=1 Tax=Sorghum bicolor TaxID=4558 RepID=A0A1Z5S8H7_SORBI|nr:hypothetical protein SORBI_3001G279601 [Sorghum bicolor]
MVAKTHSCCGDPTPARLHLPPPPPPAASSSRAGFRRPRLPLLPPPPHSVYESARYRRSSPPRLVRPSSRRRSGRHQNPRDPTKQFQQFRRATWGSFVYRFQQQFQLQFLCKSRWAAHKLLGSYLSLGAVGLH